MSQDRTVEPDVATALDRWALDHVGLLTTEERQVLRRWQGTDRYYESIQRYLRGALPHVSEQIRDDAETLQDLLLRDELALTEPVTAWRGIRSRSRVFGSEPSQLPQIGARFLSPGLIAATVHREVAEDEFMRPEGTGGSALFEIHIPDGIRGAWMPVLGAPRLAYQGELLLNEYTPFVVRGLAETSGRPLITLEVVR